MNPDKLDTAVTITDEMVERACAVFAKATGYYVEFHRGLRSESADKMREAMRDALAASLPSTGAGMVRGLQDAAKIARATLADVDFLDSPETKVSTEKLKTLCYVVRDLAALEPVAVAAEPVAWMDATDRELHKIIRDYQKRDMLLAGGRQAERAANYAIPLYTAPLAVDQAMRVEPREAALVKYPLLDSESDNDVSLARGALRQGFIAGYRASLKQEGSK